MRDLLISTLFIVLTARLNFSDITTLSWRGPLFVVLLIVLVAALALMSDIHLIVASKRREIGILRAMGANRRVVTWAFVLLGGHILLASTATWSFNLTRLERSFALARSLFGGDR